MIRKLIATGCAVSLIALVLPTMVMARVVDRLITVIDGEPYTLRDVEQFAKKRLKRDFPAGDLDSINEIDRDALEQFITERLLEAEVREAGIKVSDGDVDFYIEEVKKNNGLSENDFKAALQREGLTLENYKKTVKNELEKNELIRRQVSSKVSVTDGDVGRYYQLNAKKYRSGDRAQIRHILLSLSPQAVPEVNQTTLAKAKQIHSRIRSGEDFAKLAAEFSEGAGRSDGGAIGWVDRGTLIPGLDEVAFEKLAVGQVSEPFRTNMGYHIVKLEARELGSVPPLSAIESQIKTDLTTKALEERYLRWLKTDLRRKHRVDIKLAGVVFKPEESKEGTMDSLIARSNRSGRRRERTFLSYFNPFSYVSKETPMEELDPNGPLADKNIVSVFGVPMFTTERSDDVPEIPPDLVQPPGNSGGGASGAGANESEGFFSSVIDTLNPFSGEKP